MVLVLMRPPPLSATVTAIVQPFVVKPFVVQVRVEEMTLVQMNWLSCVALLLQVMQLRFVVYWKKMFDWPKKMFV